MCKASSVRIIFIIILFLSGFIIPHLNGVETSSLPEPQAMTLKVVSVYPHDPTAFTQGILFHNGFIYESTGLYGSSSLRKCSLTSGTIILKVNLPPNVFAEGLSLFENTLYQLTWKNHVGYMFDVPSLTYTSNYSYTGDGWGLCCDGKYLIKSNGSNLLTYHNPKDFTVVKSVQVVCKNLKISDINELEYVDGSIYANIWRNNSILKINAKSGIVEAIIDASGLLTLEEQLNANVLNGIAYNHDKKAFYLTGKLWPKIFEVKFVPLKNKNAAEIFKKNKITMSRVKKAPK